jgi:transposase InsO family protein
MPWEEKPIMSQRSEFVIFAREPGANISELCRRYGISRRVGYKWLRRYAIGGADALADRSRRPHQSPNQTCGTVEDKILAVRADHQAWGARKIRRRLQDLGVTDIPACSTITEILRRQGCLCPVESEQRRTPHRFEYPVPNALWQMDFKGHFPLARFHRRCHPLTVLEKLERTFRTYGLPERMLTDNGAPWWGPSSGGITHLSRWLIQLGIELLRCRPGHPQTQGKDERFNRTLKAEVIP